MSQLEQRKNRLVVLDRLRGFFIVVIIIDHLSRWPSIFSLITGKALLWVTAAEGFVMISGLLVGYVRGYKNQQMAMWDVSLVLLRRAALLYIWAGIATLIYTAAIWYLPLVGGSPGLPYSKSAWLEVVVDTLTLQYTYVWVYFLSLYAVFLAAAPIAIWLFRKNKAWLVGCISGALLVLGWITNSELLQWQFLFFIPSIAGYYLTPILRWWHTKNAAYQQRVARTAIAVTLGTIALSVLQTFYSYLAPTFSAFTAPLFDKESLSILRVLIAFIWFTGFLFIFIWLKKPLQKYADWLLLPIGTHSLTAYILHGIALVSISFFTVSSEDPITNTILAVLAVLLVWLLLKIPRLNRVIPR